MTKVLATSDVKSVGFPHPADLPAGEGKVVFVNGEADVTDEQLAALKANYAGQFIYPEDPAEDELDPEDAEAEFDAAEEAAEDAWREQAVRTERLALEAALPNASSEELNEANQESAEEAAEEAEEVAEEANETDAEAEAKAARAEKAREARAARAAAKADAEANAANEA